VSEEVLSLTYILAGVLSRAKLTDDKNTQEVITRERGKKSDMIQSLVLFSYSSHSVFYSTKKELKTELLVQTCVPS
jgi:hypothetical protein